MALTRAELLAAAEAAARFPVGRSNEWLAVEDSPYDWEVSEYVAEYSSALQYG
jgi:hypothetical protein